MRLGLAFGDELLTNQQRKRQVGQFVAVNMTELAVAEAEFRSTKPVPAGRHSRPRRHLANDRLIDAFRHARVLNSPENGQSSVFSLQFSVVSSQNPPLE